MKESFSLDGKKIITGRSLWKIVKNTVSTSQKISCPPGRISSFFENYFPLIPIMASTSRKIALIKNTVSTRQKIRLKDLLKNVIPIYRKVASTLKNFKIADCCLRNWTKMDNPSLLAKMKDFEIDVSSRRKKLPLSISNSSKTALTKKLLFP